MGLPIEKRNELDDRLVEDGIICYETGFNDGHFDTNDFDKWLDKNGDVSGKFRRTTIALISQYLKTKKNNMTPKIIITIRGGLLQSVISNMDIKYALVDWDNINEGDEFPTELDYAPDVVTKYIEDYLLTLKEDK